MDKNMASNSIIYCEQPIFTQITQWLNEHVGRISVGKRSFNGYEILAYSDNWKDSRELRHYARSHNASYITSMETGGVTAID